MKKLLIPVTALGLMLIVSCGNDTHTESSEQENVVTTEEMTPGQHLDTAIERTESAAVEVKEEVKQSAEEAREKVKAGLQKATVEAKDVATEAKDKVKEGVGKAAEGVEKTAKDVKEDMEKR